MTSRGAHYSDLLYLAERGKNVTHQAEYDELKKLFKTSKAETGSRTSKKTPHRGIARHPAFLKCVRADMIHEDFTSSSSCAH